jgi:hypothetical protein
MRQGFVERRRAGPVNRLRRMLYGLLLGSASAPALAGSPLGGAAGGTLHRLPMVQTNAPAWMHDNVLLARDPLSAGGALYAYSGLGPALSAAAALGPDYAFLPVGNLLFTAHYLGGDLKKLGKGLGVDLAVPQFGYFHLNLFAGRDDIIGGQRWRIDPQGFALPESAQRSWSLGGSLAVEAGPSGRRQVLFVPQLVLNLDAITHVSGRMQAVLSYHEWHSRLDRAPTDNGPVPQVSLKWWF